MLKALRVYSLQRSQDNYMAKLLEGKVTDFTPPIQYHVSDHQIKKDIETKC